MVGLNSAAKACPTGALASPYDLNASRCLCYLTEYDVPFPVKLRPVLENRLIGCDECQAVCPYSSGKPDLSGPGETLLGLALAADSDFKMVCRWFEDEYGYRPRSRELILRTLSVNLANLSTLDPSALGLLEKWSAEPHRALSECAKWALTQPSRKTPPT